MKKCRIHKVIVLVSHNNKIKSKQEIKQNFNINLRGSQFYFSDI